MNLNKKFKSTSVNKTLRKYNDAQVSNNVNDILVNNIVKYNSSILKQIMSEQKNEKYMGFRARYDSVNNDSIISKLMRLFYLINKIEPMTFFCP